MSRLFLTPINLAKNELQNARIQNLASDPVDTASGLVYYNTTTNTLRFYNNSTWVDLSNADKIDGYHVQVDGTGTDPNTIYLKTTGGSISVSWADVTSKPTTLSGYGITDAQPQDADLTAIAGLTGNGYLRKVGGNWQMDTSTYLTAETDTLATVTGRGATTSAAISITNATASTNTTTGALVVTGGVGVGGNVNVGGNIVVTGNLTVNGTTTTVNSTTVTIDDPVFTLGGDTAPAADDNKDRGIEFRYHDGTAARLGFFGYDDSTGKFTFLTSATNTSEVFSGTKGTIDATILGADVSGAVATATNADKIDGYHVQVDGTGTDPNTIYLKTTGGTISVAWADITGKPTTRDGYGITDVPKTDGTGASGTWGISISGNAATATNVAWSGVTSKPTTLSGYGITDATKKYSVNVGDGTALSYVITHNLGTRDVIVQVYTNSGAYATVECDVELTSTTTATLRFAVAPTANQYRVVVVG